jgi:hypothetical protein
MKNKSHLVLLTLLAVAIFGACKKSGNSTPAARNSLVFIYHNDNSEGVAVKSLLEQNGCTVTLLDRSMAGAFDYSGYVMIIIGNNTDALHAGDGWLPADAMKIKNSGKPILLMGQGGMLFANDIPDTVNWESSATNSLTGFKAMDPANILFKQPKAISIGADSLVTLYASASGVVSFYAKTLPVPDVVMVGMETGAPGQNYYSVSVTDGNMGAFGYYSNINAMTATGKDFFVNLVYYVGGLAL